MSEPQEADTLRQQLLQSSRAIEAQLQQINRHPLLASPPSRTSELLFQFLKGAAFGLGSVLGAGLILSLVVYLLSQIQFVPIIGELIRQILEQIPQKP
mgnify:CR=1 FL=1